MKCISIIQCDLRIRENAMRSGSHCSFIYCYFRILMNIYISSNDNSTATQNMYSMLL